MAKGKKTTPTGSAPLSAATLPYSERAVNRVIVIVLFLLPFVFYWKYAGGAPMLFGTDWLGAGSFAMREWMTRFITSHHTIAYWLPDILCGQPTGAAFFADLFYPTQLLRLLLPIQVVWTWTFILHIFLAGLGTWLFLRELGTNTVAAALGGVAYMFAGSLVTLTYGGHDGRLIGSALLPLAMFFLHRGMTRRQLIYFLLMGLVIGLQLLSGHLQKVYYTGLILLAWFLFEFFGMLRTGRAAAFRLALYFVLGVGCGVALSAVQYLPIAGNMPYAARGGERGYEYASSWSMPLIETFDLLTPRFSGGLESYWSRNPFKLHSEYLGILPLLFAAIAIFRRWRERRVKFLTLTGIGVLLMAWGGNTPFYYIPYYLFPGVSKFRGPAMFFFAGAFILAALAGLGIDYLLRGLKDTEVKKTTRTAFIAAGVPVFLLLVFAAFKEPMLSLLGSFTIRNEQKLGALAANYPNMLTGLLIAAAVAAIGLGLALLFLRRRVKLLPFAAVAAVVMVLDTGISFNLWNEPKGYIKGVPPPAQYFAPDEVVSALKADTSLYRVLPLNYERSDEGELMYGGISSTGGQLPNPLQSYQDFIGAGQSVLFAAGNLMQPAFMNLANVKYVISYTLPEDASRYDERNRQAIEQLRAYFSQPQFALFSAGPKYTVYQNLGCLPRAFVATEFAAPKDKDELLSRLAQPGFDPGRTVLLYDSPGFESYFESLPGAAAVEEYGPNRVRVRTEAAGPALLVLSDNYHPAWQAKVDGQATRVLRAYHTFRAIPVPAGQHEVTLDYDPKDYRLGGLFSLAAALFLVITGVFTIVRRRKTGVAS